MRWQRFWDMFSTNRQKAKAGQSQGKRFEVKEAR